MITTLTLSPAFDVHACIQSFCAGRENLAETVTRDVGGKGINISRALTENGIPNTPIVLVGKENGADFACGLTSAGLSCRIFECEGRIRENITIHPSEGEETRLSFKGFSCSPAILDEIEACIDPNGIVTFTGSLPGGISSANAEVFLNKLKNKGAKVVIDSKSIPLEMLRRIRPWLIKPNAEECEAYFGKMTAQQLYRIAAELNAEGIANVMISLGGDGAILAAEGKLFRARVQRIKPFSTIGAGDSTIAGFIAAETSPAESLRRAVAYGTAACLREGTNPPLPADIERIYRTAEVEEIHL
ncbi:MAG: 1-phosphofructokinase family hexose kinase [Ruminococcaceae bacterium]|nr:1-phosphofructokinase family hexose kinase [Oscillospiraceae bacterium]